MRERLVFRVHALQRMFQRGITEEEVRQVLATGKPVEAYPDEQPYPSRLVLGLFNARPLHVVVADNEVQQEAVVSTVYEPDTDPLGERLREEAEGMTCVICKQGKTQAGKTTVTLERDGMTLVFKEVPAQVCANCAEAYLDDTVSAALLKVAEEAARCGVQVDIREFTGASA